MKIIIDIYSAVNLTDLIKVLAYSKSAFKLS